MAYAAQLPDEARSIVEEAFVFGQALGYAEQVYGCTCSDAFSYCCGLIGLIMQAIFNSPIYSFVFKLICGVRAPDAALLAIIALSGALLMSKRSGRQR